MSAKSDQGTIPTWAVCAVLVAISVAVYARAVTFDFTGYDDNDYVTENVYVQRGLSPSLVWWAFTTGHAANWHPITWISHAIDWQIAGKSPWMHHAGNVALHAANAALLFVFFRRATGLVWPSFFVAALFALHPLNVQSVAWVAERKNVLSTFFGILSLMMYADWARDRARYKYVLSGLLLALGLMSKPMLVTWPFVMLVLDVWPLRRIISGDAKRGKTARQIAALAKEKAPFFALIIVSSAVTYLIQSKSGATGAEPVPILFRLENAVVAYMMYLVKTVWPFGLAVFYPHPLGTTPWWLVAPALVLLTGMTVFAFRVSKARPYVPAGWLIYVGTLVPVIGIVQVGSQAMADRYAYVPLIGIFVLAAYWLADTKYARAAGIVGAVVLVGLAARTWDELSHWRNGVALWEHAVAVTPKNAIAHNNLGGAYRKAKQPEAALAQFQEALRVNPNHAGALVNLGTLLLERGQRQQAATVLEQAVAVSPNHGSARVNLALAYLYTNQLDKAFEQAVMARELRPYDPNVLNILGIISETSGRRRDAIEYLEEALRLDPANRNARANLDRILSGRSETSPTVPGSK